MSIAFGNKRKLYANNYLRAAENFVPISQKELTTPARYCILYYACGKEI